MRHVSGNPHTVLRHLPAMKPDPAFLDLPDIPPELAASYTSSPRRPPPESAFSSIVNWCHAHDLMHVVADLQERWSFTGALQLPTPQPEPMGSMQGILQMLSALPLRCTELHVPLRNANDANDLCDYLHGLGADGPRTLSINLSDYAPGQVVPQELGRCILSLPRLRELSLSAEGNAEDITFEAGFFTQAQYNCSIEQLTIDCPLRGEPPCALVRPWLANKALASISLGACGGLAATFCWEIMLLAGHHAVRHLHFMRPFADSDKLIAQVILAQTGIVHLTLPPVSDHLDMTRRRVPALSSDDEARQLNRIEIEAIQLLFQADDSSDDVDITQSRESASSSEDSSGTEGTERYKVDGGDAIQLIFRSDDTSDDACIAQPRGSTPSSDDEDMPAADRRIQLENAVEWNFDLQSLAVAHGDGTMTPIGSEAITDNLHRNYRIHIVTSAGLAAEDAIRTELARSMGSGTGKTLCTLSLNGLVGEVSSRWGPARLHESVLKVVLADARRRFEIIFDFALNPNDVPSGSEPLLPPQAGRRALPPAGNAPPSLPDVSPDDPWPALVPRMATILQLPGIPGPVKNFLSDRKRPPLEEFSRIALRCLENKLVDVLVSMQLAFPDFVGELDWVKECPEPLREDPILSLMELRDAGVQFAAFSVTVTTQPAMNRLVEFLASPGMRSSGAQINIGPVSVPSSLGHALFSNPWLRTVRINFPWMPHSGKATGYPAPDFFDALEVNSTLQCLQVHGLYQSEVQVNCDFGAWICRGAVEEITLATRALAIKVTQALVASAGQSRVRVFKLAESVGYILLSPREFNTLFDQRLELTTLALPTMMLTTIDSGGKLQAMVNEILLKNNALTQILSCRVDGATYETTTRAFSPSRTYGPSVITNVLERNRKLQWTSMGSGIRVGLAELAKANRVPEVAFSETTTPFVRKLIEAGKLNPASLTQLTYSAASTTREAFRTELAKDRTGAEVFGAYFADLFSRSRNPLQDIYTLFRHLRATGAKLTNPGDYEALKQIVLQMVMDRLEKMLQPEAPAREMGPDHDPTPEKE